MVYVVIGVIILVLIAILALRGRKMGKVAFSKSVSGTLECDEGKFFVTGNETNYVICKDDRFEFTVNDGQIVSVKDKAVSNNTKAY